MITGIIKDLLFVLSCIGLIPPLFWGLSLESFHNNKNTLFSSNASKNIKHLLWHLSDGQKPTLI